MCTGGTGVSCLVLHPDTAWPSTSTHPGGSSPTPLLLSRTAPLRARAISRCWKAVTADYNPSPTLEPSHGWDLQHLFELGRRHSLVFQLLAAIDRELSTARTLLHRQPSTHTSWIHYSDTVAGLNDGIKIRYHRSLKALHAHWKETHRKNPPSETREKFLPSSQCRSQLSPGLGNHPG